MTNLGNGVPDGPKKPTPKTKPSFEIFKSQTNRKRRNKPSTPPLITTTTEDTIFKLLLEQIELKETTTKSSDDLSSLTVTTHLNLKNNDHLNLKNNEHHHRPTSSTSTIISSTIIEELVVTKTINFVESIDVKSADAGNGTEKIETFQKASFFPSKNPSNALQLNWILITILITASIMILH